MESDRTMPIFVNIILIFISTTVALVIGEVGLRLWGFQPGNAYERLINHNDSFLGYRMIPGSHEDIKGPGGVYSVDIIPLGFDEEIGFRDDGITEPVYSIFLGDSFVWGYGVSLADSVSEQFERLSGRDSVNLGMTAGTSPIQYSRLFSEYGSELGPEFAFIGFFIGNDFGDSVHFANWILSGKTISYPAWMTAQKKGYSTRNWNIQLRLFLYSHSSLFRFISDRIDFGSNVSRSDVDDNIFHVKTNFLNLRLDKGQLLAEWTEAGPEQLKLTQEALEQIQLFGEQRNIEVVVFIIPTKEMVYQILLPELEDREIADVRYSSLLEILSELEITSIDLLPIFQEAASDGEQLYFEIDGHWNARGHQLAAVSIYDFIHSNYEH
jgi:hypothetical protein